MPVDGHFFISPHLDDVALSCGGYLHRLASKGERVVVVTAVTADLSDGPLSSLARRNHLAWHLGDAPFAARRQEDAVAVRMLGASPIHLGMLDAIYRRDESGLPLYPYRATNIQVHPEDWAHFEPALRQSLRQALDRYGTENRRVFCPLGLGSHVDHLIVRRAVENIYDPKAIRYYEDFPYAARRRAMERWPVRNGEMGNWEPSLVKLTADEIEARAAAIACYTSQLPGLFPSRTDRLWEVARARLPALPWPIGPRPNLDASRRRMVLSLKAYVAGVGGEHYWRKMDQWSRDAKTVSATEL